MKKLIAITAMMFMGLAALPTQTTAQASIHFNIGQQPAWGPTGYDYAQYYYFPDYNFYYDITRGQYIVFRRNAWVYTSHIPAGYGFNPYRAYKVVINQGGRPYAYNHTHVRTYASYKGQWNRQSMIRDSRDYKYYASTGHPRHNEWNQRGNQYGQSSNVQSGGKRDHNSKDVYTDGRNTRKNDRMGTANTRNQNNTPRNGNVKTGGGRTGR